tara:strand:- start:702 stop:932 length:231 start_codon:yes stop_codon:yes gene_type:complete
MEDTYKYTMETKLKLNNMNNPIFEKNLINKVDDGFNYFNDYRLEELKTDDNYYIKAFMKYIEELEKRTKELKKQIK